MAQYPRIDYDWCDGCEYERPYCERRAYSCPETCGNVYHDWDQYATGERHNHCHCHVKPTTQEKRDNKCKFFKPATSKRPQHYYIERSIKNKE